MDAKRMWVRGMAAVCLGLAAGSGWADASRFEEPIRYRRAVMTMIKWHGDRISAMIKNPQNFNRDEAQRSAAYIEFLSRTALDGFVPDSFEGDTKAKPEIWKDWNRYKSLAERFQGEAAKLKDIARSGDPAALKAQMAETNKVCKTCHEDYKASKVF